MVQPVIPLGGYGGWRFLQSTFDRQFDGFASSSAIANDRNYLVGKLSQPLSQEDFVSDQRLRRVALTAFGLEAEFWKRGFIDRVLTEAVTDGSTFLQRLNSSQYARFAEVFAPVNGQIQLSPETVAAVARDFEAKSFEIAVGEVDGNLRLGLTFEAEIGSIVSTAASGQTALFRLLGNVPVRTVLESALNLPAEIRKLPIDRQAEILRKSLGNTFGITDLAELAQPEKIDRVLQRFFAIRSAGDSNGAFTSGAIALTLLESSFGFGPVARDSLLTLRLG